MQVPAHSPELFKLIDLNEQVLSTLGMLHSSLGERIALSASLTPRLGGVRVDASALQMAILHLVANARIYAERDSLLIETENISLGSDAAYADLGLSRGEYICLTISDTGTGIVPKPIAHSLPSDCRMGLFIAPVYAFAKRSGGTATIRSEPGRGTIVRLYLPRAPEAAVPFVEDSLGALRREHLRRRWQDHLPAAQKSSLGACG